MKHSFIVFFTILTVFFLFLSAHAFQPFPDTGQTKCYDDTGEIPCPSPGQPFYGQDAQYQPRLPRSYTKLGHGGIVLPDTALHVDDGGQWIMTRDNVTGLIWELKTNANIWDTYSWEDAQSQFIPRLNNATFGGFSDWRLPDIQELSSLVNAGRASWFDDAWFPKTRWDFYWSSTTTAQDTNYAWNFYFYTSQQNPNYKTNGGSHVRAVRSGPPPKPFLINNHDGTVTDTTTGLMWQQCSYGETRSNGQCTGNATALNWRQALEVAESLTLAGHSDWRLPNRNELQSLMDYTRHNPAIDPVFKNFEPYPTYPNYSCWSSTPTVSSPMGIILRQAWYFDSKIGKVYYDSMISLKAFRAVRGGNSNIESFGSLGAIIEPQGARTAGAKWRVSGGAWHDSGVLQQVPVGTHTVEFMNIPGWTKPASRVLSVSAGQTLQTNGTYVVSDVQGAILEGFVIGSDAQGRSTGALAGVLVGLIGHGSQTTDSHGKYRFEGVFPGSYEITATKTGYHPATCANITLKAGDCKSANLSLIQQSQSNLPELFNFQAPQGKHIIPGMPGNISFSTDVAWNGTPGSVRFQINGVWHVATLTDLGGGMARAMVSLSAPANIATTNELIIEATNGEGKRVSTRSGAFLHSLPQAITNWFGSALSWWLDNSSGKLKFFLQKEHPLWELKHNAIYTSTATMGLATNIEYEPSHGKFKGSIVEKGAFKHSVKLPDVEHFGEGSLASNNDIVVNFSGLEAPHVLPGWGIDIGGKAGLGMPLVRLVQAVFPPAAPTVNYLMSVPGVKDILAALKAKFYLMGGVGVKGVYNGGFDWSCYRGATNIDLLGKLGAELQVLVNKGSAKIGVTIGGAGVPEIQLCPEFDFKGVLMRVYLNIFAEAWMFGYSDGIGAEIRLWGPVEAEFIRSLQVVEPGSNNASWKPIGTEPLKWGSTNRLAGADPNEPVMRMQMQGEEVSEEESPEQRIVENVIGLASPKVAASDSDVDILFVAHNTDKPWHAATDIGRVHWGEGSNAAFDLLTDDLAAEFSPALLTVDSESMLASWVRVDGDVSAAESPDDIAPHLEIVASWFDTNQSTWSGPVQLTANAQLDRAPLPVRFGGTTGVLWVQNQGAAMTGNATLGDSLMFSAWTGTDWAAPVSLWSGQKGILEFSFVADDRGHIVLAIDEDGDTGTIEDRELYRISTDGGVWQAAVRLTDDIVEDSLPVLVAPDGAPMLVWKAGSTMLYTALADWNPRDVYPEYTPANEAPTLAGLTLPGGAAIAYSAQGSEGVDIWAAFYDSALDMWSLPRRMTGDEHAESSLSMAYDGSELVLAYLKTQTLREDVEVEIDGQIQIIENAPKPGRTDLHVLRHTLGSDPAVGTLIVEPANPHPGTQATVNATCMNQGDVPLENIQVRLYSGDPAQGGVMIGQTVVAGPLAAGTNATAEFAWSVPDDPNSHALFVVVDPDLVQEDRDRTNNMVSLWTVLPDVAVDSAWSDDLSPTQVALTARVINQGVIPTGVFDLSWRLGAVDGPEIGRSVIEGLTSLAVNEATFVWNSTAYLGGDAATIYAVADPDQTVRDMDAANNIQLQSVKLTIDGSLQTTIEPQAAIDVGAQWRRLGTTDWLDSGHTEHDLTTQGYTVEFKTIPGWDTPANAGVTVNLAQTALAQGLYVENTNTYDVTAATVSQGGSVTGSGTFLHNTWVTLTAVPDNGYEFLHWTEDGQVVSMDKDLSFLATEGRDLEAHFKRSATFSPGTFMLLLE